MTSAPRPSAATICSTRSDSKIAAELGERPVHPHLGAGCHGPRDAGDERPVARVGKDTGRVAADRVLRLARDAAQPRVLGVRASAAGRCRESPSGRPRRRAARRTPPGRAARRPGPPPARWPGRRCWYGRRTGGDRVWPPPRRGPGRCAAQASSTLRRSSAESSNRVRPRTLLSCATGAPEHDRRHPVNVGVPDQQGPIAVVVEPPRLVRPSRRGGPPLCPDRPVTPGMPDRISPTCACRRRRRSSCPSS